MWFSFTGQLLIGHGIFFFQIKPVILNSSQEKHVAFDAYYTRKEIQLNNASLLKSLLGSAAAHQPSVSLRSKSTFAIFKISWKSKPDTKIAKKISSIKTYLNFKLFSWLTLVCRALLISYLVHLTITAPSPNMSLYYNRILRIYVLPQLLS